MSPKLILIVLCSLLHVQAREGIGGGRQDWGYITVRPNAHMFWWLHFTTHSKGANYTNRPLIIWLQGGPGMSSTGYGNFLEVGPLDANLQKRENSFVENFNVLFIDNPVGVGYSYFSEENASFVSNGEEIGEDLYNFFEIFINTRHKEFAKVPLYVFGESYGGKMATEFVYKLKKEELNGNGVFCNLRGLGLGDAYISPIDYLEHYAPLALNLGLVDKRGFKRIDELAKQTRVLMNKEEYQKAIETEYMITNFLYSDLIKIDLNNFLAKTNASRSPSIMWEHMDVLESVMNRRVKEGLNITANVTWDFFSNDLYESLRSDLIKSVTDKIEFILNKTDTKILVYNGILDFIVNTAGTLSWLDSLNWERQEEWFNQNQTDFIIDDILEGYSKRIDNLVFYAILRAGHMVPIDNLPVLNEILRRELIN